MVERIVEEFEFDQDGHHFHATVDITGWVRVDSPDLGRKEAEVGSWTPEIMAEQLARELIEAAGRA